MQLLQRQRRTDPAEAHAECFAALGDPVRLAIVRILAEAEGTLDCQRVQERLEDVGMPIEQPTVSYHMRRLRAAGPIDYERNGLHRFYRLCPAAFAEVGTMLAELAKEER